MHPKRIILTAIVLGCLAITGCANTGPVKHYSQQEAETVYSEAFVAQTKASSSLKTHCERDTRGDYSEGEWSCEAAGWIGEHDCVHYEGSIDPGATTGYHEIAFVKIEKTNLLSDHKETGTELPARVCEELGQ